MKDGFLKVAAAAPMLRPADPMYNAEQIIEVMKKADKEGVKVLDDLLCVVHGVGGAQHRRRSRDFQESVFHKAFTLFYLDSSKLTNCESKYRSTAARVTTKLSVGIVTVTVSPVTSADALGSTSASTVPFSSSASSFRCWA